MPPDQQPEWTHPHAFVPHTAMAERGTRRVLWITAVTMLIEITAGWWFNSMALLADGWHMSSHAVAIGLSALAYALARRYAADPRFAFGTWKIEVLGGFASALFLLGVAGVMVVESVQRLLAPQAIHYQEAVVVAVLGLAVNLGCARILGRAEQHDHPHGPAHHHADHRDLNLQAAYVHVLADAATSILAIVALLGGWFYGWAWLDPVMGLVGAVLVAVWAKGLIGRTGTALLDREMDHAVVGQIRQAIEGGPGAERTRITDLHVWRVGTQAYACALTVVTDDTSLTATDLRRRLAGLTQVVHSTIEIHRRPPAGP